VNRKSPLLWIVLFSAAVWIFASAVSTSSTAAATQPKIEARKAPVLNKDGLQFRDLNKMEHSTGTKTGGFRGAAREGPDFQNDRRGENRTDDP